MPADDTLVAPKSVGRNSSMGSSCAAWGRLLTNAERLGVLACVSNAVFLFPLKRARVIHLPLLFTIL
ncbi:hypothetical protein IJT93_05840 [bacterium]|nr:hypothetical protein [bacterium]